jgi:hypothetical protein
MRTRTTRRASLAGISAEQFMAQPKTGSEGRQRPVSAPLALRLRVLATRWKLDREIASGSMLGPADALMLRFEQLTHEGTRGRIASDLRGVVEYVDRRGPRPVLTAVVIEPGAVRSGRRVILDLARTLEGTAPVTPRGIIMARRLLTDGTSPLFNPDSELNVSEAVWAIQDALQGDITHADGRAG